LVELVDQLFFPPQQTQLPLLLLLDAAQISRITGRFNRTQALDITGNALL
jgi:hypothetical protein